MTSLTSKLILAFLIVGLAGVALVAVLVGRQTRRAFDQFLINRFQAEVIEEAAAYYELNGASWDGVDRALRQGRQGRGRGQAPIVLFDAQQQVVADNRPAAMRDAPLDVSGRAAPITVNDAVVGYLLIDDYGPGAGPAMVAPEAEFLGRVRQIIVFSALGAGLLALVLGVVLAGTITRPVHELTEATKAMTAGELGRQVPVTSDDELGQLATLFNQMSADLAQAAQTRRQMTADIAHDLRTPLTVILGYTEALADGKLPGDPDTYRIVHQQAQHLSRLVDDLRTLSLADTGQLSLQRAPISPAALLEEAAAAYSVQADSCGVALRVEAAPDLPAVTVDRDRMLQVLGNLLSNALRHTPRGGQVALLAAREGDVVALRVRDSGPGIAADDLPHVFDRFYRGDKARAADGATGLGLAIVRSLVEAQGGRAKAESAPGQGATFTVSLPYA